MRMTHNNNNNSVDSFVLRVTGSFSNVKWVILLHWDYEMLYDLDHTLPMFSCAVSDNEMTIPNSASTGKNPSSVNAAYKQDRNKGVHLGGCPGSQEEGAKSRCPKWNLTSVGIHFVEEHFSHCKLFDGPYTQFLGLGQDE